MYRYTLIIILVTAFLSTNAQDTSYSFDDLTNQRLRTNKTGDIAMGSLALVNIASGIVLANTSFPDNIGKSYGYGAIGWGAIEGVIALVRGGRYSNEDNTGYELAYENFDADLSRRHARMFLNIGLVVSGAAMTVIGQRSTNPYFLQGIGLSTATQGIVWMAFDSFIYGSYNGQSKKWMRLLQSIEVNGNSVGFVYRF